MHMHLSGVFVGGMGNGHLGWELGREKPSV